MGELTPNARRVLQARYLRRDAAGHLIEDFEALCARVAGAVAGAEAAHGGDVAATTRSFEDLLLRRVRGWLAPGGTVFLSARLVHRLYERAILTVQRLAGPAAAEWGDSHTRWVASDGKLHRSYVRYFRTGELRGEIRAAGRSRSGAGDPRLPGAAAPLSGAGIQPSVFR